MPDPSVPFALGRFSQEGGAPFLGVVVGGAVARLSSLAPDRFAPGVTLAALLEDWPANLAAVKAAMPGGKIDGGAPVASLRALAPLPEPRQIFCTGANYGRHVVEMVVAVGAGPETAAMDAGQRRTFGQAYVARQIAEAEPYVFMKPVTSVAGPNDPLVLPGFSDQIDWEIELGVVIAAPAYRVHRDGAMAHVAGYMVVNDLTARDRVRRTDPGAIGPDWIAAKGAPGFLPTGPYLVPAEFVPDPRRLRLRLVVNGETMQDDTAADMTFDIPRQIEAISAHARMLPGDIVCTGSPAGNGIARGRFLRAGDVMEAEIDGLGRQVVHCTGPAATP